MSTTRPPCWTCGKTLEFGESHNYYDCVQHLEATLRVKEEQIEVLVEALETAQGAIASLPQDALGIGREGKITWSIRDEICDKLRNTIKEATS